MKLRPKAQLPPLWVARLLALVLIGSMGSGCPGDCVGPACEDNFGSSTLALHLGGSTLTSGRNQDPQDGALRIRGGSDEGQGWAPLLLSGGLLLGQPDLDELIHLSWSESLPSTLTLSELSPPTLSSARGSERFGASLARVKTLDGADLWVGAPAATGGSNNPEAGAVYLFSGDGDGFTETQDSDRADLRLISEAAFDHLGEVMAACGDLDADGQEELLLTASWDETGAPMGGRVYLLSSIERETLGAEALTGELDMSWTSSDEGAQLGRALLCRHDLTEAGQTGATVDIALGAPFADSALDSSAGVVYVLAGEALPEAGDVAQGAAYTLSGSQQGDHFGAALAAGDMDGDGAAELAVGAPGAFTGTGVVNVFTGSGLASGGRTRDARIDGEQQGDHLGAALTLADLDGDGLMDLAIGAPRHNTSGEERLFASGAVYVFLGASPFSAALPSRSSASSGDATLLAYSQFMEAGQVMVTGELAEGLTEQEPGAELMLLLSTNDD